MSLSQHVNTFGQAMLRRYGERVHKVALDAGFTCPNRDGTMGIGGCTFCNNDSFSPNGRRLAPILEQLAAGRRVLRKRTGARKYIAYYQAYTNTYDRVEALDALYQQSLAAPDVIGISVGTRPDCVPDPVLDLLAGYRDTGLEVWLELGLQSSFDATLERVRRGHGFGEYLSAVRRAHERGLQVCTHLIVGLPGETAGYCRITLERVLTAGVEGLKIHPLHVVRGTRLANQWRAGDYRALEEEEYVNTVADLVEATPPEVVFHRLTGTAPAHMLLAPSWCVKKWEVLNRIEGALHRRGVTVPEDKRSPVH